MVSETTLQAIEARLAATTPDSWVVQRHDYYDGMPLTSRRIEGWRGDTNASLQDDTDDSHEWARLGDADLEFAVQSHNQDIRHLIAEVRRQRAAMEQIATATGHDDGYCVDCAAVLVDIARAALGVPLRRPDLP